MAFLAQLVSLSFLKKKEKKQGEISLNGWLFCIIKVKTGKLKGFSVFIYNVWITEQSWFSMPLYYVFAFLTTYRYFNITVEAAQEFYKLLMADVTELLQQTKTKQVNQLVCYYIFLIYHMTLLVSGVIYFLLISVCYTCLI